MNPKFLGAQTGTTVVLHTWGQNLSFHPHVHCIVPGGGLSKDGLRFIRSGKKFFIPVKVLSRKFRGKFLFYLKQAWHRGDIKLFGDNANLAYGSNFINLIDSLYRIEWVAYCKKPFKSPDIVVKYLGRYTHRVAISNSRIVAFDMATVTFEWKDYKDKNKVKLMTLKTEEFVRRFLLHVLPSGFTRIRHYGILSSRNINSKLSLCSKLSGGNYIVREFVKYLKPCPLCNGSMAFVRLLKSDSLSP
jgi:hypothetical protein